MKVMTRAITLLVVLNLAVVGISLAGNAPDEEVQEASEAVLARPKETELATKEAEVALKQAEAAMKQAQKQTEGKKAMVATVKSRLDELRLNLDQQLAKLQRYSGAGTVLVIPATGIAAEDLVTITEDMNVMSRILDNKLKKERLPTSRPVWTFSEGHWLADDITELLGSDGTKTAGMYLQGYGALFLLKVDFPLSPPPQAEQEEETKEKEDTDPVWDQVKRDMYEPQAARRRKADRLAEKYDAEKVENLKTAITNSLKHAANIRNLKPDESVVVTIAGSGASAGNITSSITTTGQVVIHDKDRRTMRLIDKPQPGDLGLSVPAVLTIRATKPDIDAFAKGELDFEKFREQVAMFTYPYLAGGGGQGESHDLFFRSLPR